MADVYGNSSRFCVQGQGEALGSWPLALSHTNPQTKTNPKTSPSPRLSGEIGVRR
jgi:hypothetical protein